MPLAILNLWSSWCTGAAAQAAGQQPNQEVVWHEPAAHAPQTPDLRAICRPFSQGALSVLVMSQTQTSYVIIVHRRIVLMKSQTASCQAVAYCKRHRNLAWPAGNMVELHESAGESAYNVPYLATVLALDKSDSWYIYVVVSITFLTCCYACQIL